MSSDEIAISVKNLTKTYRLTAMLENGIHYHPALVEKLIKHAGE